MSTSSGTTLSRSAATFGAKAGGPQKVLIPENVIRTVQQTYRDLNNEIAALEQKNMNLKMGYTAAQREYAS